MVSPEKKPNMIEKPHIQEKQKHSTCVNHTDSSIPSPPLAIYGHSITSLNNNALVVLFGGQTGGDGKTFMSGETYIFCNNSGSWTSVNGKLIYLFVNKLFKLTLITVFI